MKDRLLARLQPYDQQHVLDFWDELDSNQREALAAQIDALDLDQLASLYRDRDAQQDIVQQARRAKPPPAVRIDAADNPFSASEARQLGQEALAARTVGVALVAGGQGARLGFDHPKGMYPIGPVSGASLFQILLRKIVATGDRYQAQLPLYLMTSPATHDETLAYMEQTDRCGLMPKDLQVFCQGTMPAVDAATGRLLLSERDQLFLSPDGHGGMLAALERSGALQDMQRRGLKQLFYFQVDNPLATVCDAEFIGYHLLAGSQYTVQVIAKQSPDEKVGNTVQIDGRSRIIEYSDLPTDVAARRGADGSLKLWAGSIAVHVLDVKFLCEMAQQQAALPFHRAIKKVPYIDQNGQRIDPAEPNAIKFEKFIFDLLPRAEKTLAVEVQAAVGFAPLKNGPGAAVDTEQHVQQQMIALDRQRLRAAGVEVSADVRIEISPLFAMDTEQLKEKLKAGTAFTEDTYLE